MNKRIDVKAILADADLRRKLMVSTIQATQAREGINTTSEQANRAYSVVTEAERVTFFALERFKGGKRGDVDRRHEMFLKALRHEEDAVRHDVARRDFGNIEGHPLAYERVAILAPIFREAPSLSPAWAVAAQGLATAADERFVRYYWEIPKERIGRGRDWVFFAKGGDYSRFYADVFLVVDWRSNGQNMRAFSGAVIRNEHQYYKAGLTWPRRTQRGFNVRGLPADCIFADKGPSIFPVRAEDEFFLLGTLNSALVEYILQGLTSFGSWEVGAVQRLPIPIQNGKYRENIATLARLIQERKRAWDSGNEISTNFVEPWLVALPSGPSLTLMLDEIVASEGRQQSLIQQKYAELNEEIYRLYSIPAATRSQIEATLGVRPPEVLWPQTEGKSTDQKRMEHVWRVLSYAVKRVVEANYDGIVPFTQATGEACLVDLVRHELARFFSGRDENQLELEIVNELKRGAKGYRKCASLDEWLANAFFEYHVALYKGRPIFWHIASSQGTDAFAFGAIVHYHRFDKNRIAKLRATYVRDTVEEIRRDTGLADKAGRTDDRVDLQAKIEEAQSLDVRLQQIQEGHHEGPEGGARDFRILTPWKQPDARPRGWAPDLDDGVRVNIAPLERAGVLRVARVAE